MIDAAPARVHGTIRLSDTVTGATSKNGPDGFVADVEFVEDAPHAFEGGGCIVDIHLPNEPFANTDQGPVSLNGTGLVSQVPAAWTYSGGRYECVAGSDVGVAGEATTFCPQICYEWYQTSGPHVGPTLLGHVRVSNMADARLDGVYPMADRDILVFHPRIEDLNIPQVDYTNGSFEYLFGYAPIPDPGYGTDLLVDELVNMPSSAQTIRVVKGAGVDVPSIDETLRAAGGGIKLTLPQSASGFPSTVHDVRFSCRVGEGGTCGFAVAGEENVIEIVGRTTDAPTAGTEMWEMTPPVSSYATFQCRFSNADTATIPSAAIAKILSTNPSRVELRVGNYHVRRLSGEWGDATILAGHAVLGYTTLH